MLRLNANPVPDSRQIPFLPPDSSFVKEDNDNSSYLTESLRSFNGVIDVKVLHSFHKEFLRSYSVEEYSLHCFRH